MNVENQLNPNHQLYQRIKAALFDAACFIILAFILNGLLSFIVTRNGSKYNSAFNEVSEHIEYSGLAKSDDTGYATYESSELSVRVGEQSRFIDVLSYYYLNYLPGINLKEGTEGSKEKVSHDVEWFNKNILEIGEKQFFKVKSDKSDSISTEIGVVNESFFVSGGLVEYETFVESKYNSAVTEFYNLDFIKEDNRVMRVYDGVIIISSSIVSLLIFYFAVPAFYKSRQTFGKRIFKCLVVKNEELVSLIVLLLRLVPSILVCGFIGLVNETYWQFALPILAILVSSGLMLFTKKRRALHDFVAGTDVISLQEYLELKHED